MKFDKYYRMKHICLDCSSVYSSRQCAYKHRVMKGHRTESTWKRPEKKQKIIQSLPRALLSPLPLPPPPITSPPIVEVVEKEEEKEPEVVPVVVPPPLPPKLPVSPPRILTPGPGSMKRRLALLGGPLRVIN